jgi:DNA-binding NarL/FixJ family response regulator
VLKEAADSELVGAVRRAAVGEGYLNPRWAPDSLPSVPPLRTIAETTLSSRSDLVRYALDRGLVQV